MDLPPYAKVGHRKYKIESYTAQIASADQRYGFCDLSNAIIKVDAQYGIEKARDTLLHEILHAIYYEWGLQDEDKEERIVSQYGTALTQVMCDSPELRTWLGKAWAKS